MNNGAGREEKGNLLEEAARPAGGRASEGGESSLLPRCQQDAAAAGAGEGAPKEPVGQLGKAGRGQPEADRSAPAGRGAGEPGQRGEPRGARPGRAPGAAEDAARRVAVAATAPLWL